MITFRCTQKVRDLLKLRDRDLADESDSEMEEWFVETATIERYRCLLFTHKVSLYSFWALAVRKPDLLAFEELFRHHALAMLKAEGFTDAEVARLLPAAGHRREDEQQACDRLDEQSRSPQPLVLRARR